jgi:hypothetical protein
VGKLDKFRRRLKDVMNKISHGDFNAQFYNAEFNKMLNEFMDRLVAVAEKNEKITANSLRNRISKICAVDTLDINGRVYQNNSLFTIDIYIGLLIFIHKLFKIFVSQTGTAERLGNDIRTENSKIDFDSIVPIVKAMLKAFWEKRLFTEQSWIETKQLTNGEIIILEELRSYAEMFIVAHEIAHIVYICNPSTKTFARLPSNYGTISSNWNKEIGADILGLIFCLLCNSERAPLAFSSIELFFIVQKMIVDFYTMEHGFKPKLSITHPPCEIRLKAIREFVQESNPVENWFAIGEKWEIIANSILDKIYPTGSRNPVDTITERGNFLRQKGLSGYSEVERLIEEKQTQRKIIYPNVDIENGALKKLLSQQVYCISHDGYWILGEDVVHDKKELTKSLAWLACDELGVPKSFIEKLMQKLDREL